MINLLFFGAGLLVGALMLASQLWTVNRIAPQSGAIVAAWLLLGMLGRLALVAVLFVAALRVGIVPCLLAGAGLLVSRWGLFAWLEHTDWRAVEA